jgi:hypothetical protein
MLASLPILFIGTSILFVILLLAIRLWRPDFGYSWLITAFGALIVWTLILISRINLPQTITLSIWALPGLSSPMVVLVLDGISWPYAFSVGTILLAVVLTDIARAQESDWSAWTASLSLTALGLLAVLAGNPLTLILGWAALDFAELLVMFWHVRSSEGRRQASFALSGKVLSLFLLLWAWIIAGQSGSSARFDDLPDRASLYLLLAAWIRVVMVPLNLPQMQEQSVQRGLGTLLRLISAAAALVLFARTSRLGFVEWQEPYLLGLAVLTALYGGLAWMYSKDEITGHAYWIIGVAALVMASAVSGEENASMAWGLTGLLSGALLFLYSIRGRLLVILPAFGLLQLTGLPLTQAWNGVALFRAVSLIFSVLFLISQALLLAGYFSRMDNTRNEKTDAERWVVLIYVWGLVLILLAQMLLAFLGNIVGGKWVTPVNLATLIPGFAACGLAALLVFLQKRGYGLPVRGVRVINSVFSLNWLYYLAGRAYSLVGKGVALATLILEGEGGILWALLWLVLLFALIVQGIARGI